MHNTTGEINKNIGKRVKTTRRGVGCSQKSLAEYLGITYQQIQKYESGLNRISAEYLVLIATYLNVDVCTFFADKPVVVLKSWSVLTSMPPVKRKFAEDFILLLNKTECHN